MKLTVLTENTACRDSLTPEHGLSLYIETETARILFDAGQSCAFAHNAEMLGVDLRSVDFAVLSHGHYDHGGGLARFLEINPTAPVYLRRDAFGCHHNGEGKFIGLDAALKNNPRLIFTEDTLTIAPGITLHSCNDLSRPFGTDSAGLTLEGTPDTFLHEQYLLIEEAGKRILISGCSHKGILNIVSWFSPDVLIGGFHFMKMDPASPALDRAAETLLSYPTVYYTGHCTGQAQFDRLKTRMGSRLHVISTGSVIIM